MKRILLITILLAAGCSNAPTPGNGFRLTFAPPDSVAYKAEVMSVRMRLVDNDTMAVDSSWSTTSHEMMKTADGYVIHSKTDTMWVSRDGKPVNDPIVTLFAGGRFTHLVGSDGQVRDILGYDTLFQQLDGILGPETAAAVRQNINPTLLKERDKQEWNSRMGRFAGKELFLNDPHFDTTTIQLPTGSSLRSFEVSELQDTTRIGDNLCAVIRITSHTDPRQLATEVGRAPADFVKQFAVSDSLLNAIDNLQVSAMIQSTWVVAINTMLSQSFDQSRVLQLRSGQPGQNTVQAGMYELQTKKYSY